MHCLVWGLLKGFRRALQIDDAITVQLKSATRRGRQAARKMRPTLQPDKQKSKPPRTAAHLLFGARLPDVVSKCGHKILPYNIVIIGAYNILT